MYFFKTLQRNFVSGKLIVTKISSRKYVRRKDFNESLDFDKYKINNILRNETKNIII
jgi:hypothetical protein